jgi:hypothetical protein
LQWNDVFLQTEIQIIVMSKLYLQIEHYRVTHDMNFLRESQWLSMFILLSEFKKTHGHADVPAKYPIYMPLGGWVRRQRSVYHEGKLDSSREQMLREIGFNFRLLDFHNWGDMFGKLQDFKRHFGHARVTNRHHNVQLHNWLTYQRKLQWRGKLEAEKVSQLVELGVDMRNKTANHWDEKYAQLVGFKEKHGHLRVSKHFTTDKQLVNFAKGLRRSRGSLSAERRENLDQLGFIWNPGKELTVILNRNRGDEAWMKRYEELKTYKSEFGTCRILTTSQRHRSLANWISLQRNRIDKLTPERKQLLEEIGFFEDNYL